MGTKIALVVDNSRLMRSYLKELLSAEGFENIIEAASAKEAIEAFNKHQPEFVTLDILMPDGSGLDVLEAIASKKNNARIVIVTDSGQESTVKKAMEIGAFSVIYKPVKKESLKSALQGQTPMVRGPKPRALVVDDSMMMRVVMRRILEDAGCEVVGEAVDVPNGIKAYQDLRPDLMSLDLVMPGGSGLDVLKSVMSVNPKSNVIVVSAVAQEKIKEEVLSLGAKAILNKPVTPQKMKEALAKTDIAVFSGSSVLSVPPPAIKKNGDGPAPSGWTDFRELLIPATEKCVEALDLLSQSQWAVAGIDIYERSSYNMQVFPPEIRDVVFVQMAVANDVPVMGLFGAPHEEFLKMAQSMLKSHFSSFEDKDGVVNLMILEWANIIVTNFLNVFADALGYAVMSFPPELINSPIEEAIRKASTEISDIAQKILAAHIRFSCAEWNVSCETILMVREDCLDRIIPKK